MTTGDELTVGRFAFDADTDVEERSGDRYAATVTGRWNALNGGPNGGYVLAVILQALRRRMRFPDPLVVSAFFLRPAAAGPVEVATEIVRSGRRLETGEARLVQDDKEIARATAVFTDHELGEGPLLVLGESPSLPPPEELPDPVQGMSMPELTLLERIEFRVAQVPGWTRGEPGGRPSMSFWMRFKDGRDADPMSLPMLVDAAAPAVLDIGVLSTTVELTVHVRGRPAPGWLACRVSSRFIFGGFHEEDFEIWDSDGKLVAQSRQLGLIRT